MHGAMKQESERQMTQTVIRAFEPRDAGDWARIFHTAVHGLAGRDYSPEQLHAWSPEPAPPERVLAHVAGRRVWVAVDDTDRPQALIELEPDGHIDCFYCAPDHAGTGVAAALYAHLESQARADGITQLFVEASEPARRFFLRNGFVIDHRRDFERAGVALHNYRMTKGLLP